MKKILLAAFAVIAVASQVSAQNKFGIRAGLNVANEAIKYSGVKFEPDAKLGFHIGFAYERELGQNFFFETGLYGTMKGAKLSAEDYDGENELKDELFYLQLPVLFGYNFDVSNNFTLKPFFGGYAGYALSGKSYEGSFKYDLFDYDGYQSYKRGDAGLRFGVGAQVAQHIYLGVGYELGLLNFNYDKEEGELHNKALTFTVGYTF